MISQIPSALLRDSIINKLSEFVSNSKPIKFISPDFGAAALDDFRKLHPTSFVFPGICEQLSVDYSFGVSLTGSFPVLYGMAPFVTARCFEQYKVLFGQTNSPILLLGIGPGLSYDHNTISHYCLEDIILFKSIPSFSIYHPISIDSCLDKINSYFVKPAQSYFRIDRQPVPVSITTYQEIPISLVDCFYFKRSSDTLVVTYGSIAFALLSSTNHSILVLESLTYIDPSVADIFSIYKNLIIVDESLQYTGIFSSLRLFVKSHHSLSHYFIPNDIFNLKISRDVARQRFLISPVIASTTY